MTIHTVLIKRRALYVGEIGFFASNPMAEEDIAIAKMDSEVICSFYSPKNLQDMKFLWGLVHKTTENSDRWLDKDEAMKDLKLRVGYARMIYDNKTKKFELRPKSLTRISNEELRLLTDKIMDVVCAEILPGMKHNTLRKEVEDMLRGRT